MLAFIKVMQVNGLVYSKYLVLAATTNIAATIVEILWALYLLCWAIRATSVVRFLKFECNYLVATEFNVFSLIKFLFIYFWNNRILACSL